MSNISAILIILGSLALFVQKSVQNSANKSVLTLNETDFLNHISQTPYSLVAFYDPDCVFCTNFLPEFKSARKRIEKYSKIVNINISLVRVNAVHNKDLMVRLRISELPTIVMYEGNKPFQIFNGIRSADNIYLWVINNIRNLYISLTCEEVPNFIASNENSVILYIKEDQCEGNIDWGEKKENFTKAIRKLPQKLKFGVTSCGFDSSLQQGSFMAPYIKLYSKANLTAELDRLMNFQIQTIIDFVENNRHSEIFPFEEGVIEGFLSRNRSVMVLFIKPHEDNEEIVNEFKDILKILRSELVISIANLEDPGIVKWVNFVGINNGLTSRLFILQKFPNGAVLKFCLNESLSESSILEFFFKWNRGALYPYIRSQKEVKFSKHSNFIESVGSNFDKIVLDVSKDVVVIFCPRRFSKCEDVLYEFELISQKLEHLKGLLFVRFDPEKNDYLGSPIIYFPVIKLFKTNDKSNPVTFSSELTGSSIDNFLKENLTTLEERSAED